MIDVNLDILPDSKAALRVVHSDGREEVVPVNVTHTTPLTNLPVLGEVDVDYMPQELLDTLFRMTLKSKEDQWWQDYFIARREDRVQYADAIARADDEYADEMLKRLSI